MTEKGIPYSVREARGAAHSHRDMDVYHRHLMLWLCDELEAMKVKHGHEIAQWQNAHLNAFCRASDAEKELGRVKEERDNARLARKVSDSLVEDCQRFLYRAEQAEARASDAEKKLERVKGLALQGIHEPGPAPRECCKHIRDVCQSAPEEPALTLHDFGYAPGNYSIICHVCNKSINDCDKRAVTCKSCAEKLVAKNNARAASKKLVFKLSEQLGDGDHWSIVEDASAVLDAIAEHLKERPCVGDEFSVEVVEMTQAEIDALPDL